MPSKAQHDLVKALWAYRRLYDPAARLQLVGLDALEAVPGLPAGVRRPTSGSTEAVRVTGEVSDAALAAYFAAADVYVSLSVHEGFGVPLLEAMRPAVPVVALAAGAVAGDRSAAPACCSTGPSRRYGGGRRPAGALRRCAAGPAGRGRASAGGPPLAGGGREAGRRGDLPPWPARRRASRPWPAGRGGDRP